MDKDIFAEIEYDADSPRAVPVRASQIIGNSNPDPVRKKFYAMRDIAPSNPYSWNESGLFYKQGKFMEDFEDDYSGNAEFTMFAPCYQRMGYERLRTFFTWRSKVRKGEYSPIGLSYIFMYLYELMSNIGVKDPSDGLNKLMAAWVAYRKAEPELDDYLPAWLKDYHIYYPLPHSFADFVEKHQLIKHYADMFLFDYDADNCLDMWNVLSGYNINNSKFYNASTENAALVKSCFRVALLALDKYFANNNTRLRDIIVRTHAISVPWVPFRRALFYRWLQQEDRTVELPGGEIYSCVNNDWHTVYNTPQNYRKELASFFIRKTEACVRHEVGYKPGLTVGPSSINKASKLLLNYTIFPRYLDNVIANAISDHFMDLNRIVVNVDINNLTRIREESQDTAEKLIVQEAETGEPPVAFTAPAFTAHIEPSLSVEVAPPVSPESPSVWATLKDSLTETERRALALALDSASEFKAFADSHGIMPEVLADSINEKAMDIVGDNILEFTDTIEVYDEYRDFIH